MPMIENDSPVEVAGIFSYVVRLFGRELGDTVDRRFIDVGAPEWFAQIRNVRRAAGNPVYDDKLDPRFLLKEASTDGSPVRDAIPGFDEHWRREGYMLMRRINSWQHFAVEPTAANLETVVSTIWDLSLKSSLTMASYLAQLVTRIRNIRDGVYMPANAPSSAIQNQQTNEDTQFTQRLLEKVQEQIQRPPVGAPWTGPLGERRIRISSALRDVTENGTSIRDQLPGGEEQVLAWLRYYPQGGDARVADDGAVTGFIKGQPTLIGWVGSDPHAVEYARGFTSEREYVFNGQDIVDETTLELLSKQAAEPIDSLISEIGAKIQPGTRLKLTSYNDLVTESEDGSVLKLETIHPGIWFKTKG